MHIPACYIYIFIQLGLHLYAMLVLLVILLSAFAALVVDMFDFFTSWIRLMVYLQHALNYHCCCLCEKVEVV